MLDAYTCAFARYLRTGTVGVLSRFCDANADLSRLRVYRNGFLRACIDALRANYPSVERLVGEERFPALARPWVDAHPPRDATLVEYGDGFAQYIADARATHGLDWLGSFAALDRAWTEVHFAEDDTETTGEGRDAGEHSDTCGRFGANGQRASPVVGPSAPYQAGGGLDDAMVPSDSSGLVAAAGQSTPDSGSSPAPGSAGRVPSDAETLMSLRGRLSPRVRQVSLEYRVLDAWCRLRESGLEQCIEVRHMTQSVLVWRAGAEMLYRDLAPPEHAFIAGVASGRSCGDAAASALGVDADFDLAAAFASLLHHRMLTFEH